MFNSETLVMSAGIIRGASSAGIVEDAGAVICWAEPWLLVPRKAIERDMATMVAARCNKDT